MDNPWADLPSDPPFLLPHDAPYVNAWNELNHGRPDLKICLDYPPEPFLGRHDAPLVVLQANPGLGPSDHKTWADRAVIDRALESARAENGTSFFWLRDKLAGTAGANWWRSRTQALHKDRADLADRLLAVEFHGYHSKKWQPPPVTLPSQPYGFGLVQQAIERGAVIVVLRGWREWQVAVPGLQSYERLVHTKSAQNSHLTPRNVHPEPRWQLVCQALSHGR